MFNPNYNVLGVMSGTSLDGIDISHIQFEIKNNKWRFLILESETISYSESWLDSLKKAVDFSELQLEKLNEEYTVLLAEIVSEFIDKYKLKNLDAVCSHGHTILHQPQNGFTLQIGNLSNIAQLINQKVVCNFRVQDVALGGQGAPLVPIGDELLFPEYDYCLNLGGFSNISYHENNIRIAFDISAVNTVLNYYANQLGFDYDNKGEISRTGEVSESLLLALNNLDFYKKKHPKSLGFEFVKTILLPIIETFEICTEDKLSTFSEHIAYQISKALPQKTGRLLITGGGAFNVFLIERIQYYLPNIKIEIPNQKIIEYKEALIFALLGVLKLQNEINVLASVTGASRDHSSGMIFEKN